MKVLRILDSYIECKNNPVWTLDCFIESVFYEQYDIDGFPVNTDEDCISVDCFKKALFEQLNYADKYFYDGDIYDRLQYLTSLGILSFKEFNMLVVTGRIVNGERSIV